MTDREIVRELAHHAGFFEHVRWCMRRYISQPTPACASARLLGRGLVLIRLLSGTFEIYFDTRLWRVDDLNGFSTEHFVFYGSDYLAVINCDDDPPIRIRTCVEAESLARQTLHSFSENGWYDAPIGELDHVPV